MEVKKRKIKRSFIYRSTWWPQASSVYHDKAGRGRSLAFNGSLAIPTYKNIVSGL